MFGNSKLELEELFCAGLLACRKHHSKAEVAASLCKPR